jgi:regulatory protein
LQEQSTEIIIVKIEKNKQKRRYHVHLSNDHSFSIHEDLLVKYQLSKNLVIDLPFIEEIIHSDEQHRAYLKAILLLGIRTYTVKEISDKLKQKGFESSTILKTIDKLQQLNYLNDEEYAQQWAEQQVRKHQGSHRIRYDLKQKGLSPLLIQEVLQRSSPEIELQAAIEIGHKKWKTFEGSSYQKKAKLMAFLHRRGYTKEIIETSLKTIPLVDDQHDDVFWDDFPHVED